MICLFFFFFQAEDGIRDIGVTGVQTCALPIWLVAVTFPEIAGDFLVRNGDRDPRIPDLLASLPYVLERGEAVLGLLDRLYPGLPKLVIYGGCPGGGTPFQGGGFLPPLGFFNRRLRQRGPGVCLPFHPH